MRSARVRALSGLSRMREAVPATPRGSITEARKRRIWEREKGKCWMCGKPVEMLGPTVRYDHRISLELSGTDDDSNIYPIHRDPCDKLKCKADAAKIAKVRRLHKKGDQSTRKPPKMKSAGFRPKPDGFKYQWGKRKIGG